MIGGGVSGNESLEKTNREEMRSLDKNWVETWMGWKSPGLKLLPLIENPQSPKLGMYTWYGIVWMDGFILLAANRMVSTMHQ